MTKKSILGAIIVVVIAGGVALFFWHAHEEFSGDEMMEHPVIPPASLTATSTQATTASQNDLSDALRQEAMRILAEPFSPAAGTSDADKTLAEQKIKDASDMLRANYNYANPWYDIGAYRKMVGDFQGAIDAWSFVERIRPDDYIAPNNLGDLYAFTLHDYANGEAEFLKSIANEPTNVNAYMQLVTIYEHLDTAKAGQVPALLKKGLAANPKNKNLLITLGQYYESTGDMASAKTYLEQALQLDPSNTDLQQEIQALGK
ncbi:MAG: tetratricopeptide repeat protein [Patescibacteria group bacterium]|nr:tetratricopeptide repeat protein [Patescibacteria group bacterium]